MSRGDGRTRVALVVVGALVSVLLMVAPSWATGGTTLCIPTGENAPVKTPLKNGTCASTKTEKYTLTELGAEGKEGRQGPEGKEGKQGPEGKEGKEGPEGKLPLSDVEAATLKGILPCITSVNEGIDGKPTVQFHGCNVQIVNGEGETASTNGEGNLVIGYDETEGGKCSNFAAHDKFECEHFFHAEWTPEPQAQTGSHDLILGNEQTFTSYAGIVAGRENSITGPFASVTGGTGNEASGFAASVIGGALNTASGEFASVSAGLGNTASNQGSAVSGGFGNTAQSTGASVSGGKENTAHSLWASVTGGRANNASSAFASVSGGKENTASGQYSSVLGGHLEEATAEFEHKP